MAVQAPERRGKTLEDDLARAFALSQADKRLGDYFPPIENSTHSWHFDGTEHNGGGFDGDAYAYRSRAELKRDWEVSVVQWARERDVADKGWKAEEAARGVERNIDDRKMKTIWSPEEADLVDARKAVEQAWAQEQMELEGLASSSPKKRRHTFNPADLPTPVDARRLNESFLRPSLGEESTSARTGAWLKGHGPSPGVKHFDGDPSEQNEIHTMEIFEEELRRKRRAERVQKAKSMDSHATPVRRSSTIASSKPPSLPAKDPREDEIEYIESPKSIAQSLSRGPSERAPSRHSVASGGTIRPRQLARKSRTSMAESEALTIPPSLPSKDSGRGSPDSMETESRRTERSDFEEDEIEEEENESVPEPIHILSPITEESKSQSTKVRSRPASTLSRYMGSPKSEKDGKQRPISFHVLTTDSQINLKQQNPSSVKITEEEHVRTSSSSWKYHPPDDDRDNLLDEPVMPGLRGISEPSMSTLVVTERVVSPAAQLAQSFRQLAMDASADPTNPNYLRDIGFTVPGMFSRSANDVATGTEDGPVRRGSSRMDLRTATDPVDHTTPKQRRISISQTVDSSNSPRKLPRVMAPSLNSSIKPPLNVQKSLPGTPYTTTHSVVSGAEFDADALEVEQQTEPSYYRKYQDSRETLPPGYSSGSKTPRGSMLKQRDSYASTKEYGKSVDSLASAKSAKSAKTSSTGVMGDAEAEGVTNILQNAQRRPSKKSSTKHRHKPEGSQVSSDGSGSTIKASAHSRSQSSTSDDGRAMGVPHPRYAERAANAPHERGIRRMKPILPPGSSHTRVIYSDSESMQEENVVNTPQQINIQPSPESLPMSVDVSDEDGDDVQYAMLPEPREERALGRMSSHTFGLPTGTNMTFRESKDLQTPQDSRNASKVSLSSRPQSMATSMKSNHTKVSTLRASLRSPLPGISERDTASELSFREDDINASGSLAEGNYMIGSIPSEEALGPSGDLEGEGPSSDEPVPAWRADLWGKVAWDAAAAGKRSSSRPKSGLSKLSAVGMLPEEGHSEGANRKSSSSSFGEELKNGFSLPHRPDSYHGTGRSQSLSKGPPSGVEDMYAYQQEQHMANLGYSSGHTQDHYSSGHTQDHNSSGQSKHKYDVGAVVPWQEDTEVGMAGVGAHGIRAQVSYKEPDPVESDTYDE